MPHVEIFNPELDRAGSRMDSIESRLQRFNNPAPTVPQYDLSFGTTITDISAYLFYGDTPGPPPPPTDNATISICADDAGGTVPGTVLGVVTTDGTIGGAWSTPTAPSPVIHVTSGEVFWLLFDRTATKHAGGPFYTVGYSDDVGDVGEAGINPAHGFQWMDSTNTWFSFSTHKLAVVINFSNGASINNTPFGGSGGISFGWGDQTSLLVATKFIVP